MQERSGSRRVGRTSAGSALCVAMLMSVAVLVAGAAQAAKPDTPRDVVGALLSASGADEMIDSFIVQVRNEMNLRAADLAGDHGQFFRDAFEASFDPGPMRERVIDQMLAHYEDDQARGALAWFESPEGQKVRKEESYAQSAAAENEMRQFIVAFEAEPPNPERMRLAGEIDRARASSTLSHDLVFQFMRGLALASSAISLEDGVASEADIEAGLREQLDPLMPSLAQQMVIFYTFMGRNLTLEENRAYLSHIESKEGRWFYPAMHAGLVEAMGNAGSRFGADVTEHMEKLRRQAEAAPADRAE